jgi:hypothetical protein
MATTWRNCNLCAGHGYRLLNPYCYPARRGKCHNCAGTGHALATPEQGEK